MVHEIFIVEDEINLVNELVPIFKDSKDIILKSISSRFFK